MLSPVRSARSLALQILAAGALAALPLAAAGCNWESGTGFSQNRFIYRSNAWRPQTLTLVDTRTGEVLWSLDVPVGQQAVVGFHKNVYEDTNQIMPDELYWGLMPADDMVKGPSSRMPCPPADSRLLEVSLRPTPEMPNAVLTNRGPVEAVEILETEPILAPPPAEPVEPAEPM